MFQWVGLHTPSVGGPGSIPGQGTRSCTHATAKSSHAAIKKSACATTKTQGSQNK